MSYFDQITVNASVRGALKECDDLQWQGETPLYVNKISVGASRNAKSCDIIIEKKSVYKIIDF